MTDGPLITMRNVVKTYTRGAETLRVGTECTYHPFNFRDADGALKGYDVDVAKAVGERIGAQIELSARNGMG